MNILNLTDKFWCFLIGTNYQRSTKPFKVSRLAKKVIGYFAFLMILADLKSV